MPTTETEKNNKELSIQLFSHCSWLQVTLFRAITAGLDAVEPKRQATPRLLIEDDLGKVWAAAERLFAAGTLDKDAVNSARILAATHRARWDTDYANAD